MRPCANKAAKYYSRVCYCRRSILKAGILQPLQIGRIAHKNICELRKKENPISCLAKIQGSVSRNEIELRRSTWQVAPPFLTPPAELGHYFAGRLDVQYGDINLTVPTLR